MSDDLFVLAFDGETVVVDVEIKQEPDTEMLLDGAALVPEEMFMSMEGLGGEWDSGQFSPLSTQPPQWPWSGLADEGKSVSLASAASTPVAAASSASSAGLTVDKKLLSALQQSARKAPAATTPASRLRMLAAKERHVSSDEEEEEDDDDDDDDSSSSSPRIKSESSLNRIPLPHNVTFYQLTEEQLATIDFKELVRLMREAGMTEKEINEAKARRRRLKNRLSARVCSNKKREKCAELADANSSLKGRVTSLDVENRQLKSENQRLSEINTALSKLTTEQTREIQALKAQLQQQTYLLLSAGIVGPDAPAAFAA